MESSHFTSLARVGSREDTNVDNSALMITGTYKGQSLHNTVYLAYFDYQYQWCDARYVPDLASKHSFQEGTPGGAGLVSSAPWSPFYHPLIFPKKKKESSFDILSIIDRNSRTLMEIPESDNLPKQFYFFPEEEKKENA